MQEWVDDKSLASLSIRDTFSVRRPNGAVERMVVGSDGYVSLLRLGAQSRHRAFIEPDRGTVPLTRWANMVATYLAYFQSAPFRQRSRAAKPFRVLTVTTSETRLRNMIEVTEQAGGHFWFLFTTYERIHDPAHTLLHPAWHMAGSAEPVCSPYPLTHDGSSTRDRSLHASAE